MARDFSYAQTNDCLMATENGVSIRLTSHNSDYIWREIAEGEVRGIRVNGVRLINVERFISVQRGNEAA